MGILGMFSEMQFFELSLWCAIYFSNLNTGSSQIITTIEMKISIAKQNSC